ncbi:hypothetical protein, partial [Limnobacter sp.]|uniref:hypothetical protein n=1 Tax=Limnobacter sp. TaxID=2003368 RepID=UPI00311E7818
GKFSDWSSCDPLQVQLPATPVRRFSVTKRLTAVFNGQSALANFPHWATHDRVHRPIGGGVSIASPSRKPALACRAGPVLPSMGDRERTRPAV